MDYRRKGRSIDHDKEIVENFSLSFFFDKNVTCLDILIIDSLFFEMQKQFNSIEISFEIDVA